MELLLIGIGGGLGAVLRFGLHRWVQGLADSPFPSGTLAVNLLGCLAVGFCAAALATPTALRPELRLAIMVGLLGGFTTFSTFGLETVALLDCGRIGLALLNLAASNAFGLLGVWLGMRLADGLGAA